MQAEVRRKSYEEEYEGGSSFADVWRGGGGLTLFRTTTHYSEQTARTT